MTTTGFDFRSIHLSSGAHEPGKGVGCLMEAASYLAGEAWSDHPACVCPVVAAMGRRLNDLMPDDVRQRLLAPRLFAVLNTVGDRDDQERRAFVAADWAVRRLLPMALRQLGLVHLAVKLESLPQIVNRKTADAAYDAAAAAALAVSAAAAAAALAAALAVSAAVAAAAALDAADAAYDAAAAAAALALALAADWDLAVEMFDAVIAAGPHAPYEATGERLCGLMEVCGA